MQYFLLRDVDVTRRHLAVPSIRDVYLDRGRTFKSRDRDESSYSASGGLYYICRSSHPCPAIGSNYLIALKLADRHPRVLIKTDEASLLRLKHD